MELRPGKGGQIAPPLDGIGNTGVEALLRNILTPSAAMESAYRTYRVVLKDGAVQDGFLASETPEAVVLRTPGAEDRRIVEESLARVGMLDFRDRQIGELSGGQKKRVFLARALAQRGRIILLDEPFTGVDVQTESTIIELLRQLRTEGHLMLVSTHNLGSVPEFCDQVVLVNRTVLACGPTLEVFTEQNLTKAFGGVLRHFRFDESTVQKHDGRTVTVLSDDERPLVFGKGGHLEFSQRQGREEIVKQRAEEPDDE